MEKAADSLAGRNHWELPDKSCYLPDVMSSDYVLWPQQLEGENSMDLKVFMTDLGPQIGLTDLQPDSEGRYAVRLDDVTVTIAKGAHPGDIDFASRLGEVDLEDSTTLVQLLSACIPHPEGGLPVLGVDLDGAVHMRQRVFSADLSQPVVEGQFERYINLAHTLMASLKPVAQDAAAES